MSKALAGLVITAVVALLIYTSQFQVKMLQAVTQLVVAQMGDVVLIMVSVSSDKIDQAVR